MAKKVFAVTNIKGSNEDGAGFVAAGEELDHTKFTKEQLTTLLDEGAIEVREVSEENENKENKEGEEVEVSTPGPATFTYTPEEQGEAEEN